MGNFFFPIAWMAALLLLIALSLALFVYAPVFRVIAAFAFFPLMVSFIASVPSLKRQLIR